MTQLTPLQALKKAVKVLDGQTSLAAVCGQRVRQQHVYNWLNRDLKLPEKYALKVQAATSAKGEAVLAHELCPEAFPENLIPVSKIEA